MSEDDDTRIRLTVADGLAHLRLSRPEAHNAIDAVMVRSLARAVDECSADESLRALLITAEGPSLTVGGDLRYLTGQQLDRLSEELDELIGIYHRVLAAIAALGAPVVCAVQGAAAGGGLGLLWCSDVVIAAEDAVFATGFARIALSGDGSSSWHLPRLVGLRRATELLLEGRILSAPEALDWGLVNRVVPRADLDAEARAVADRLAAGPTAAYGEMRRLLRGSFEATFTEGLDAEHRAMVRCGATTDAQEGIAAFVERRDARFTGR